MSPRLNNPGGPCQSERGGGRAREPRLGHSAFPQGVTRLTPTLGLRVHPSFLRGEERDGETGTILSLDEVKPGQNPPFFQQVIYPPDLSAHPMRQSGVPGHLGRRQAPVGRRLSHSCFCVGGSQLWVTPPVPSLAGSCSQPLPGVLAWYLAAWHPLPPRSYLASIGVGCLGLQSKPCLREDCWFHEAQDPGLSSIMSCYC